METFKIFLKHCRRYINIPSEEISHIKSEDKYSTFWMTNGSKYYLSESLSKIQSKLPNNKFVRIHNNCLINTNFIFEICLVNNVVTSVDKQEFKVSRRKIANLKGIINSSISKINLKDLDFS